MKTRKLISLLALAAAVLLVLASCDNMLESIYPEDTNPSGNNSITLYVSTYYSAFDSYGVQVGVINDIYYGPLTVVLKKDGVIIEKRTSWLSYYDYNPINTTWTFNGLPDGTYDAYVWIDKNQNSSTSGDVDFGWNWPAVDGAGFYGVTLGGNSAGTLYESVYWNYGYEKTIP